MTARHVGRVYRRDGYVLVGVRNPVDRDERAYHVYVQASDEPKRCVFVGTVGRYMATRERGSPRKRYVTARWQSPGWWHRYPEERKVRYYAWHYPGEAARRLVLEAYHRGEVSWEDCYG